MTNEIKAWEAEQLAVIGVAWCESSHTLDAWSRLVSGVGLLVLWFAPATISLLVAELVIIAGLIQLYYAVRLSFDRPVFAAWAAHPENATLEKSLGAFDALLKQSTTAPRGLHERVAGTRRLFYRQLVCVAAQAFLLLVLMVGLFRTLTPAYIP